MSRKVYKMTEIVGKYNTARCFAGTIGENAVEQIRAVCDMEEYESQMAGIYSTCISHSTLDESPMAYKSLSEIVENVEPTAEIIRRIKPVYNFKAAE